LSVQKITKEMFHCKCDRPECGYEWDVEKIPLRCAGCKSRSWNHPVRKGKTLTFNGETLTILQWSRKLGLSRFIINWRIKQGWPIEQILVSDDWRRQESVDKSVENTT